MSDRPVLTGDSNQQKVNKEVTYTYWVDDNNKSRQLPPEQRPKKIEAEAAATPDRNEHGPSAWNSCGTWEEKKVSLQSIQTQLTTELKQWLSSSSMGEIELEKVSLTGQIHKIYKKQKWHMMFQITGSIQFTKDGLEGEVKLQEITDNGDQNYSFNGAEQITKMLDAQAESIIQILRTVVHTH